MADALDEGHWADDFVGLGRRGGTDGVDVDVACSAGSADGGGVGAVGACGAGDVARARCRTGTVGAWDARSDVREDLRRFQDVVGLRGALAGSISPEVMSRASDVCANVPGSSKSNAM